MGNIPTWTEKEVMTTKTFKHPFFPLWKQQAAAVYLSRKEGDEEVSIAYLEREREGRNHKCHPVIE